MAEFRRITEQIESIELKLKAIVEGNSSIVEKWNECTDIETILKETEESRARFNRRLKETDPITGDPRYGPSMKAKVENMLSRARGVHEQFEVQKQTAEAAYESYQQEQAAAKDAAEQAFQGQNEAHQKADADLEEKKRLEEARAAEKRIKEAQKQKEMSRQAEQLRLERRSAQEVAKQQATAAKEARLAALRSVPRGGAGLGLALDRLGAAAGAEGPAAHRLALETLAGLLAAVVARPEDAQLRRVNLDNPRFRAAVGRHDGGPQALAAAGFAPEEAVPEGAAEGAPPAVFLVSREPDLAGDLDGWSAWFDLLRLAKETVAARLAAL